VWKFRLAASLALLATTGSGPGCARGDAGFGERLVLITLDTLRYDRLVGDATRMPNTRRWAEEATSFARFYATTATTLPTHATLLTGLHPWEHGVVRNGLPLDASFVTVAERLRGAGFATAAVVAALPLSRRFGLDQGFDVYRDAFELRAPDDRAGPYYSLASSITDAALAVLAEASDPRQFLWVHYYDPHAPYGDTGSAPTVEPTDVHRAAREGRDGGAVLARARDLYDADVRFLDTELARLLERLAEDAERFVTHVVITADHGEAFGEDGALGHGKRLIPAALHVPALVRSPRMAAGTRHDVAGTVDLAPTLLSLAGLVPATRRGRSLIDPTEVSGGAIGMRRSFDEPYPELLADGRIRAIEGPLFYRVDGRGRLVRGNATRLMDPAPDAARLRERFAALERDLAAQPAPPGPDSEVAEGLRALGYAP
jgi:arylsulfatase A-like enzyme